MRYVRMSEYTRSVVPGTAAPIRPNASSSSSSPRKGVLVYASTGGVVL